MSPKIAGMESSAKSRSVVPSATTTANIGVKRNLAFSRIQSLPPRHSSVCGSAVRTQVTILLSSYSSSSSGPCFASLKPV